MTSKRKTFTCINCGCQINELCRKYSSTVLKLVNCNTCKQIADKYIEYDIVIVIIDLILLRKEAYRHILYNTEFKIYWKLAIMLQMMELYSEWNLMLPKHQIIAGDIHFYILSLKVLFRTICSIIAIIILTTLHDKVVRKKTPLQTVWKAVVLANFGWFLLLPSLIWDNLVQEIHLTFVSLYTTLSQLLAYTVVCRCVKIWSIIVIILSYNCKMLSNELYDVIYKNVIENYHYFYN